MTPLTLLLERVLWERVSAYEVADTAGDGEASESIGIRDFVEKPAQEDAPSNLAITGRDVLTSEIFELLHDTKPGVGGEVQLTDALRKLESLRGVELRGDRYDIGNIPDWLQANVEMALKHDDGEMHDAVAEMLAEYTDE